MHIHATAVEADPLFQLLLGAQLGGVAALLLAAVNRANVKASVAPGFMTTEGHASITCPVWWAVHHTILEGVMTSDLIRSYLVVEKQTELN